MNPQVEEIAPNRVRMTVEVPRHDVEHAVEHATSDLAASVKVPGFRPGHVPKQVLLSRIGRERLLSEAVESHIGGWFWNAAARTRVRPVSQPRYDYELPDGESADWRFVAEFDVQATPELPDWTQLEVPKRAVETPAELIDAELDALRSGIAELVPVESGPVEAGDVVVVDMVNEDGEGQRDSVVETGAGRLVEEVEQGLLGMSAGEAKQIAFELADGSTRSVEVSVKEIKRKVLPELDDELARAASEFETLAELRADVDARLGEQIADEVEAEFRSATVDALVRASDVRPGGPLVERRTRSLLEELARSVEARGVTLDSYLAMTGVSADQLVQRLQLEAALSVARELVLEAAADKLGIVVDDATVEELVREQAEAAGDDADRVLADMRESGALERLRDDLRLRDALDRVAAEVKPIAPELAEARDALWTPDKEKPDTETKLWTPGSKEHA